MIYPGFVCVTVKITPCFAGGGHILKRAGFGQGYYEKYAGGDDVSSGGMTNADCPFMVKVTATDLNIRCGAGTNTAKTGKYTGAGYLPLLRSGAVRGLIKTGGS